MSIEIVDGALFRKVFMGGVRWVAFHRDMLNELNVYPVPDGDTGTNMYLTLRGAVSSFKLAQDSTVGGLLRAVSKGALFGARGNSGVILSQIIAGFARHFKDKSTLSVDDLAPAFRCAEVRAYGAVTEPQEGTILTLVRVLAETLEGHTFTERDLTGALDLIHRISKRTLGECRDLLPVLKENQIVDAGGQGLVLLFEGMLRAARFEEFRRSQLQGNEPRLPLRYDAESLHLRFCVEYIISCEEGDPVNIRAALSGMGDSLVIAATGEVVKIHMHTERPEEVRHACESIGDILHEKCDDMLKQHRTLLLEETMIISAGDEASDWLNTALAAIVAGDGLSDVFKSAGAYVIEGGQTMNPSVEDILMVLSAIPSKNILLLANNSNCIPACAQAAKLIERRVIVLETASPAAGLSFLNLYDPALSIENLQERYENNKDKFISVEICAATKSGKFGGTDVREGELLALSEGKLLGCSADFGILLERMAHLLEEGDHLTIIGGSESIPGVDDPFQYIREKFTIEMDYVYGGQPHYPILFGIQSKPQYCKRFGAEVGADYGAKIHIEDSNTGE